MRIEQLKAFVKDEELAGIAIGASAKGDMIKSSHISANFLNLAQEKKSERIEQLFKAIGENPTKEAKRLQKKLISVIKDTYSGSDKSYLWEKHCVAPYEKSLEKEKKRVARKEKKAKKSRGILDKVSIKLSKLEEQRNLLLDDKKWNRGIKKAIGKGAVKKNITTFYKFTPLEEQHFIISSLPRSVDKGHEYMDAAIRTKKCHLFVSCHELQDGRGEKHIEKKCSDFWKNKEIYDKGFDDTTVKAIEEVVLKTGKAAEGYGRVPELIETTLSLEDGRKIKHLHYRGWIDRTECPDENLLEDLLKEWRCSLHQLITILRLIVMEGLVVLERLSEAII